MIAFHIIINACKEASLVAVILDEIKSRRQKISDLLLEKGNNVKSCSGSGEFIDTIESSPVDRIYIDVDSWQHGMGIYSYFRFSQKLTDIPITFYNAPDNFTNISDRSSNQNDKIITKQADIYVIASEI